MTSATRTIRQPGPEQFPRIIAVEARGRSFAFEAQPGLSLLEAIRRGFAAEGFVSGTAEFGSLALGPFAYVMPALSADGRNAAFYSETFRPSGVTWLEGGAMTFGLRDGQPFFHCHALWREADGRVCGGHILPDETLIAEAGTVRAFGIEGALFEGNPDVETNFKIFGPVAAPRAGALTECRAFAVRLRPNQDFHGALEQLARDHGIRRARIRGGVGSTIGARLTDGSRIDNFATEVFVRSGRIDPGPDGAPRAELDIGLIDYTGGIARGTLVRGDNPVLMTFELAIEVEESGGET